jgi:MtfA peptidase
MDFLTTIAAAVLVLAAVALIVAAWLWGPLLRTRLRRARVRRQPFPAAWRDTLRRRMPAFAALPADVQRRLKKHAQVLIAEKPFIGCAGLVITDEMRVLVAVQASLLLLRRAGHFDALRQVLMYPGAFAVERSSADHHGLVHERRQALAGEAWQQGQVILSWQDVIDGAADPHDGHNVVIHEFAHVLDHETGAANGAPWQPGARRRQRWARVMNAEFEAFEQQLAQALPTVLDPYGAQSPAEFFAVASECFFERAQLLAQTRPALYDELRQFYGVNPAAWPGSQPLMPRAH